jgi:4-alpha-glucanotransferase
MPDVKTALHQLARSYAILTSYLDMDGQPILASDESLIAVLKVLGAKLDSARDAPQALLEKQLSDTRQILEPAIASWENEKPGFQLRLPKSLFESTLEAELAGEDGSQTRFNLRYAAGRVVNSIEISGQSYQSVRFNLPGQLSPGYYKLSLEAGGKVWNTLFIRAPLKAHSSARPGEKIWGAFLPLYALHSRQSWGAGDYSDLQRLMDWVAERGGRAVGTLPLLPSFMSDKFGPGPYMPASKLFWNEFYLNIDQIPDIGLCQEAQSLIDSSRFQNELAGLRGSHFVDYSRIWSLKRQVLSILADDFFSRQADRQFEFQEFLKTRPSVQDYARFRAGGEQRGLEWHSWPESMQQGQLKEGDYSNQIERLFLYSQWQTRQQTQQLKERSSASNITLYLDMPLGVHPDSYDVWSERECFVHGANGGAPPDPVFTSGQNWNFPPLHPQKIRETGYRYVIASLRRQMQMAGLLRIDHMMGLHRLFWIPAGMPTSQGLYVGYPAEELYAILTLESQRNKTTIVGEDLGIVPPEVRPKMEKHGIFRLFVGEYELISENKLGQIPRQAVASLNTHDMYPFASFWQETDILDRQKLKLIDATGAQRELEQRREAKRALLSILEYKHLENQLSQDTLATLKSLLNLLASSQVYALLVNLEDLWLETHPQNIPGLQRQQNWSRKARLGLEELSQLPSVSDILNDINQARKR